MDKNKSQKGLFDFLKKSPTVSNVKSAKQSQLFGKKKFTDNLEKKKTSKNNMFLLSIIFIIIIIAIIILVVIYLIKKKKDKNNKDEKDQKKQEELEKQEEEKQKKEQEQEQEQERERELELAREQEQEQEDERMEQRQLTSSGDNEVYSISRNIWTYDDAEAVCAILDGSKVILQMMLIHINMLIFLYKEKNLIQLKKIVKIEINVVLIGMINIAIKITLYKVVHIININLWQ